MTTVDPWMQANGLYGKPRYGISHDDPAITAEEKLRYDAAVEVPPGFTGAGNHQMTVIPGGKYAVGRFDGDVREVGEAWMWMLRDWLPASGMQLDARPSFEHYPVESGHDEQTGTFQCEICIPITPL
jgi:AraC family transcriptional regulator